jgi:hypothetical protein
LLNRSLFPPDAKLPIDPFTFVAKPVVRPTTKPSSTVAPNGAASSGATAKYINTDAAVATTQKKKRQAAKSCFPSELVSEFVKVVRASEKTTKAALAAELRGTFLGRDDFKVTKVNLMLPCPSLPSPLPRGVCLG